MHSSGGNSNDETATRTKYHHFRQWLICSNKHRQHGRIQINSMGEHILCYESNSSQSQRRSSYGIEKLRRESNGGCSRGDQKWDWGSKYAQPQTPWRWYFPGHAVFIVESLYSSVMDRVIARASTSQSISHIVSFLMLIESYSTPASELAENIVQAALSPYPPAYLTTGATSIPQFIIN